MVESLYLETLKTRVLVFDGAMGTSIQDRAPSAADYGGQALDGCNDHLVLSRPDLILDIHSSFLDVGCDVIETNTFRANRLAIAEYGIEDQMPDLNRTAARLARRVALEFSASDRPRFVAGSIGPSGFLPGSSDPDLGRITYEELVDVFREQAGALLEGGVDLLLVETGQDILEVKAAVAGCRAAMADAGRRVPIQAQITLDTTGRMLLGTNVASARVTLEALRVDVLGLNCSTGPKHMREPVRHLADHSRTPISVIPNAGIPRNVDGRALYPLTPDELAAAHGSLVRDFGVSAVGGCCGTTPEHIRAVVEAVGGKAPVRRSITHRPAVSSGIQAVDLAQIPAPTLVGERVNAQGSRRVKELLLADDLDGVLQIAREQVEGGAHILDVSVATVERADEVGRMRDLVKLLSQGVEAPLMVDTTEVEVAAAALRQIPGRGIINSIHLEGGREKLDALLPHVVEHGAALVALTIDETGMAKTAEHKVAVATRIAEICQSDYGLSQDALVFDPLTFTLATGDPEFHRSAVETLEGIRRIKAAFPRAFTSLGISNVSFGLQLEARRVLNSVFLHHAVEAGLDMAIINPAHVRPSDEIEEEGRRLAEDLIFYRRRDALERYIVFFEGKDSGQGSAADPRDSMTPDDAVGWMILHRKKEGIQSWVEAAIRERGGGHDAAVDTLNEVLLPAMKDVGDRFANGDLILPFVLQSAEVMKAAVGHLEGFLDRSEDQTKGTVVLATVFGDVHDIGKNLVHTILENNGYTVHNLGKQVPINTILDKAQELGADAIGLSALLVSTSQQMPLCVQELHKRGLEFPVLLGGAAVTPSFSHRAAHVGPNGDQRLYGSGVFYCKDAFDGLSIMESLTDQKGREAFLGEWGRQVEAAVRRREALAARSGLNHLATRPPPVGNVETPTPPFWGPRVVESLPLEEVFRLIDRNTLFRLHWGAKNAKGEQWDRLVAEFQSRLQRYQARATDRNGAWVRGAYGYFPASADGEDLIIHDPSVPGDVLARFHFPRQTERERTSLSDYFRPTDPAGTPDLAAFQVVTAGGPFLENAEDLMSSGEYSEGYFLHGFGVRLAEAGAELLHQRIRRELGLDPDRGLRYSWGYPACPDTRQHRLVFDLLPAREALGMDLTEAGALVPEMSTAALVVHHPEARYFRV